MSSASNNFATSCFLSVSGGMTCRCKRGYTGLQCERCADGYFGDPLKVGGFCTPCKCNGNINRNLTGKIFMIIGCVSASLAVWNQLGHEIKTAPSLADFKRDYKCF